MMYFARKLKEHALESELVNTFECGQKCGQKWINYAKRIEKEIHKTVHRRAPDVQDFIIEKKNIAGVPNMNWHLLIF